MKATLHSFVSRRRYIDLVLDAVFCLWLLQVVVTGQLLPRPVVDLLHHPAPVAAITEPAAPSPQQPLLAPDSDSDT